MLRVLIAAFAPLGPLVMRFDEHLERRRGQRIAAKGISRAPGRSSHAHVVKASGLRWWRLLLLVPIPGAGRVWALPFLTARCPSERYHPTRGRSHTPLPDRARQRLRLVKRWLPHRTSVVVADSTYAALAFLHAVGRAVTVVTRLRLAAALYGAAPARQVGQGGRPRKRGNRLPPRKPILDEPKTAWQELQIDHWDGPGPRTVAMTTGTAGWEHAGLPRGPICGVLGRDPQQKFAPHTCLCAAVSGMPVRLAPPFWIVPGICPRNGRPTCPEDQVWEHGRLVRRSLSEPTEMASCVVFAPRESTCLADVVRVVGRRWQIEVGFEAGKSDCGLDEYEGRKWHGIVM